MGDLLHRCRVTKDYQASNRDPFSVQANEPFHASEKVDFWNGNPDWVWIWCTDQRDQSGWVPKNRLHTYDNKTTATTFSAYSALELTVTNGDELEAVEEITVCSF